MTQIIIAYAVIALISFVQGCTFVPQYTYFYAGVSYMARALNLKRFGVLSHDSENCNNIANEDGKCLSESCSGHRFVDLVIEVFSLSCALFILIAVYHLYFKIAFVPQHINKVWLSMFVLGFIIFRVRQEITVARSQSSEPIYVEFSNKDDEGRIKLDSFWTLRDLERYLVRLEEGAELLVWGSTGSTANKEQKLITSGIVSYDEKNNRWVLSVTKAQSNK